MAVLTSPTTSEAATRPTGDGFNFLSTIEKDIYDHDHIQNPSPQIN